MGKKGKVLTWFLQIFLFLCGIVIAGFTLYQGRWAFMYAITGTGSVRVIEQQQPSNTTSIEPNATTQPIYKTVTWTQGERILYFAFFLIICCPAGMCLGSMAAGVYYACKHFHHKTRNQAKKQKFQRPRLLEAQISETTLVPPPSYAGESDKSIIGTAHAESVRPSPPQHDGRVPPRDPAPKRASVEYRQTAAWWEDLRYKWNPNPGYIGTEQRHGNFRDD